MTPDEDWRFASSVGTWADTGGGGGAPGGPGGDLSLNPQIRLAVHGQAKGRFLVMVQSSGVLADMRTQEGMQQAAAYPALGLALAALALTIARNNRIGVSRLIFASGVGFAVALGWFLTYSLSQVAFDPVQIESATFTGPSAHTLMYFLDRGAALEVDIGLIPGVFLGAFIAAALTGELKFQGFETTSNMRQAMIGAGMMGFGGMLAGGCAIGAGVTGGSIFAGTAWAALTSFWAGGMITDWLVFQRARAVAA